MVNYQQVFLINMSSIFSAFQPDLSPFIPAFPGIRQSFSDVTSTTSSTRGIKKSRSGNLFVSTVKTTSI